MANYLRNNAWNNGGDFSNPDLLWYAKGVGKMMSRALNDPASWWFYAAIHGEYVNPNTAWYPDPPGFPGWGFMTSPPNLPTSSLPDQGTLDLYWNQCQHGSWYFFPWHRGYLMALEAQLRQDIVGLGGPANWTLPYWSYFGGTDGNQYQMPPAFRENKLPDGSENVLYVAMRYGPDADANIYVPTPAGEAAHHGDANFPYGTVTDEAMKNDLFTGTDSATPPPGFGGPESGFAHSGGSHGNFESNPHDLVHVYVGGAISNTNYGLMADPGTAALDPIFYLHHCNIDRMWAVWNASGNSNPTDRKWLDGPTQRFAMPGTAGQPWYYTPRDVANLSLLDYSYAELAAQPAPAPSMLARRLAVLGASAAEEDKAKSRPATRALPKQTELLGASTGSLRIGERGTHTSVRLDTGVRRKAVASLTMASATTLPDRAFLKLENVRGTFDATVLDVYVNLPHNEKPDDGGTLLAGDVALFGLRRASVKDGQHAGEGLTFILDITHIIDQLHLANALDRDSLQVNIVPNRPLPEEAEIQVGRISVYRQAF
jgi:tyrosinase